jgi:hypothetical protein
MSFVNQLSATPRKAPDEVPAPGVPDPIDPGPEQPVPEPGPVDPPDPYPSFEDVPPPRTID